MSIKSLAMSNDIITMTSLLCIISSGTGTFFTLEKQNDDIQLPLGIHKTKLKGKGEEGEG